MKKRYHLKKEVKEWILTELMEGAMFAMFAIAYIVLA